MSDHDVSVPDHFRIGYGDKSLSDAEVDAMSEEHNGDDLFYRPIPEEGAEVTVEGNGFAFDLLRETAGPSDEESPPSIAASLARIADVLEAQAAADPMAALAAAIEAGPPGEGPIERVELSGKEATPIGNGRLLATVNLGALRPGWSLDLMGKRDDPVALSVVLAGPGGEREKLL